MRMIDCFDVTRIVAQFIRAVGVELRSQWTRPVDTTVRLVDKNATTSKTVSRQLCL